MSEPVEDRPAAAATEADLPELSEDQLDDVSGGGIEIERDFPSYLA